MSTDVCSSIFDLLDRELWLITACAGERSSGLIATFVSSASLVPSLPRMMVGLAKHHFTHELIQASGSLGMHLISEAQLDWVWRFGIRSGRNVDKFAGLETAQGGAGAPILTHALAWLDCRVEAQLDTGDRTIFLAEVLDARLEYSQPPLTFQRALRMAPAVRLAEMKAAMRLDIESDREAILRWRCLPHGSRQ